MKTELLDGLARVVGVRRESSVISRIVEKADHGRLVTDDIENGSNGREGVTR